MKTPLIKLPTYQDKVLLLNTIYAHGLTWCGYTQTAALKLYSPAYDNDAGWTHVYLQGKTEVRFASDPDETDACWVVNSPAQFVRYVSRQKS